MAWASRSNYEAALVTGISMYVGLALTRHAYVFEAAGVVLLSIAAFASKNWDQVSHDVGVYSSRSRTPAGVLLGVMVLPLVQASRLVAQQSKPGINNDLHNFGLDVQSRVGFWSAVTFGSAFLAAMCTRKISINAQASSGTSQRKGANSGGLTAIVFFWAATALPLMLTVLDEPPGAKEHVKNPLANALPMALAVYASAALQGVLFHQLARRLPGALTVGETVLVAGGLTSLAANTTWLTIDGVVGKARGASPACSSGWSEIDVLVVVLVAAPLVLAAVTVPCPGTKEQPDQHGPRLAHNARKGSMTGRQAAFLCINATVAMVAINMWFDRLGILDGQHWLWWIMRYMLGSRARTMLAAYWIVMLSVFLPCTALLRRLAMPHIILRKSFHVLAVIMFLPGFLLEPSFMRLSFAVAFCVFTILEMCRVVGLPVLGPAVHRFMQPFVDSRDAGPLFLTHFSLLVGIASPLWLQDSSASSPASVRIAGCGGLISLGIGDTVASAVGVRYGKSRLFTYWHKSVEGTLSGFLASSFFTVCLLQLMGDNKSWPSGIIACAGACCLEAVTAQLDNAFVPLCFFTLAML